MAKNDPKVDRLGALRAVRDALGASIEFEEQQQARKRKKKTTPRKASKTRKR